MKKRIAVVLAVVIAIISYIAASRIQSIYAQKTVEKSIEQQKVQDQANNTKTQEKAPSELEKAKDNTSNNQNTVSPSQTEKKDSNKTVEDKTKKEVQPSKASVKIVIIDIISNTTIAEGSLELKDNSVYDLTLGFLQSKGIKSRSDGGYFSSINGLREKDNGPSSGWCYYVNGVKPPVGCDSYKPKAGDKIEWKYLADGISQ